MSHEIISGNRAIGTQKLLQRASKAATGLQTLGVRIGDRVAVYLRNDFAYFEASYAASLVGAYCVPMNWHYAQEEARYVLNDSGARVLVIHADLYHGIREVIPDNISVLVVETPAEIGAAYAIPGELCAVPGDRPNWSEWLLAYDEAAPASPVSLGSFIYTSGTTGHPRAVKRAAQTSEQAARSNIMVARAFGLGSSGEVSDVTTVMTGPLYHSAPNAYGLAVARAGATVILQPRFDAEQLLGLIEKHRVTHMHAVPVMFKRLLMLSPAVRNRYDTSSLRWVVHGAAPCDPETKRQMIAWFGPVIYEYYGATETGLVTLAGSDEWLEHPGTVGRAASGVTLRVLDADGQDCPPGTVGEIACRNEDVGDFTYYGDDAKRRGADRNGLIFLGDIGYLDKDGFLFLCDRAADVIISGGVNIYPAEIESVIHRMPCVADCAVFGIPDEEYGEAVCAAIQLRDGQTCSRDAVETFLEGKIGHYKKPKRIEFHDNLPREDSGKIFRRKLRAPHWAKLGRQI